MKLNITAFAIAFLPVLLILFKFITTDSIILYGYRCLLNISVIQKICFPRKPFILYLLSYWICKKSFLTGKFLCMKNMINITIYHSRFMLRKTIAMCFLYKKIFTKIKNRKETEDGNLLWNYGNTKIVML